MGKSSQRKGREGEIECAKYLQENGFPVTVGAAENRGRTPDVIGLPYLHTEVKRVEKLNVPEAMKQAERDAEKFGDGFPALFHRRNRERWLTTMYTEDFLEIYEVYVSVRSRE